MEQSDLGVLSSLERPYFSARIVGGETRTEGTPRCLLGHRLANTTDGVHDGIYVEWSWDGNQLVIQNDRYGIYPLFYSCHGNEIRISPSIDHILRGSFPKTFNYAGLSVFMRLGFYVGEDTPFEHIHYLPPGSILRWKDGKIELKPGSIVSRSPGNPIRSFDDAVEQYTWLFRQAISRRLPDCGEFTVPISGGRDSRHILLELLHQGHKPSLTVTVKSRPPSANEDVRIARLLASEFDLEHKEIDMPASFYKANIKDIELTNLCGSGHIWLLPVSAWLKGRTQTLYDGLAGSVLSGGFQVSQERLSLFRERRFTALAKDLLRENNQENFIQSTLRPNFRNQIAEPLAIERLSTELEKHADAHHPLSSYIFWNRTRRGISLIPYSILAHVQNVYSPYMDHDVFDFLMNLDPTYTLGNALHDTTIKKAYPAFAGIPFEDKNAPKIKGQSLSTYYRAAVREFLGHFARHPGHGTSRLLKSERVLLMLMRDLGRARCEGTWYLRPALYTFALDDAAKQG